MATSRGANLVGMSTMSLDACHFSLLIKKKKYYCLMCFNCWLLGFIRYRVIKALPKKDIE